MGINLLDVKPGTKIMMNNRLAEKKADLCIYDIKWERIHMYIYVKVETIDPSIENDLDFYLVTGYYRSNARLEHEKTEEGDYILHLNVTNPGYNACLPTAAYSLYACEGDEILCRVSVAQDFALKISECSRSFRHTGAAIVYTVDISLAETDEMLCPLIRIYDAKRSGLEVFSRSPEDVGNTFKGKLKKKIKNILKIKIRMQHMAGRYVRMLSKKKNSKKTVLFMSEQNEAMGANLLAVYERMMARGLDKDFNILKSFRSIVAEPEKYGLSSWLKTLKKVARADVIFVDDHCPMFDWLKLDTNTDLVQLWHAGAGYKGVGYSRWGHEGAAAPFSCHRQYAYCITPSRNISEYFSEQFGINDEQIIPTGMPRMDEYLNEDYIKTKKEELYGMFPACIGKKVILFAPTYRGMNKAEAHYPYEKVDFEKLYDVCGDEYVVLFKMHPWVNDPVPIEDRYADKFFDANDYPKINDLFYITDLYISDYSSGVFEYSHMKKPALFFAFDEIQFSYTRGFHRDYRTHVPGKVCTTFDEILISIEKEDFEFEKNATYLKKHFDKVDTNSSDRAIDWFLIDGVPEEFKAKAKQRVRDLEHLKSLDFSSLMPIEDDEEAVG